MKRLGLSVEREVGRRRSPTRFFGYANLRAGRSRWTVSILRRFRFVSCAVTSCVAAFSLKSPLIKANAQTTVPQDALLFKGSLRSNLDPFSQHTDADLLSIMSRVGLSHWALNDQLDASGAGTSAGERQLVALARTFLRKSKVVILDESTANVDVEMDRRLQRIIREELRDALVLTIAHRLETCIGALLCFL